MAVSTQTIRINDNITKKKTDVHLIRVNNSNKKGAAEAIGGTLVYKDGEGDSWYIELKTTVNGRPRKLLIFAGQVVFRTGNNKRWQVATKSAFAKRFTAK